MSKQNKIFKYFVKHPKIIKILTTIFFIYGLIFLSFTLIDESIHPERVGINLFILTINIGIWIILVMIASSIDNILLKKKQYQKEYRDKKKLKRLEFEEKQELINSRFEIMDY